MLTNHILWLNHVGLFTIKIVLTNLLTFLNPPQFFK
jgi:hypothetical protein